MSSTPVLITADDLARKLRAGETPEVWNALTDEYFTGEMIPGSRRVPVDRVGSEVSATGLPRDTPIAVYCSGRACPNSRQAAEKLIKLGFTEVSLFEGGIEAWKASGRGVEVLTGPVAATAS